MSNNIKIAISAADDFSSAIEKKMNIKSSSGLQAQDEVLSNARSSTYEEGNYSLREQSPEEEARTLELMEAEYQLRLALRQKYQEERLVIVQQGLAEIAAANKTSNDQDKKHTKHNFEEKKRAARDFTSSALSSLDELMTQSGKKNKAMFNAHKALSIAQAVIDTHTAAVKAYKVGSEFGPVYAAAMAALAIARGYAQIAIISKQKFSSGDTSASDGAGAGVSEGAGAGGKGDAPLPPDDEEAIKEARKGQQNITVNIYNPLAEENWQKIVDDNIIPALEDAGDRNVRLEINSV